MNEHLHKTLLYQFNYWAYIPTAVLLLSPGITMAISAYRDSYRYYWGLTRRTMVLHREEK